jgi:hypothetical protein
LNDLFGAEGGGLATARGVVEDSLDQPQQALVVGLIGFGGAQGVRAVEPSVTPEADTDAGQAQALGDGLQARVVSQGQQDADAARQAYRGGLALVDLPEQAALSIREFNGARRGAHNPTRRVNG